MGYTITLGGSVHRQVIMPMSFALTAREAAEKARCYIESVGEADNLHTGSAQEALDFWSLEEIEGDLALCKQCSITLCGGYYCIDITWEV